MNPPQVLIERSALEALCDPANTHHAAVADAYLALVEQYEFEQVLLVAVCDHLRAYRDTYSPVRRGPLAPIDTLHVGHQHRRAARRMTNGTTTVDFDTALTLVMCERHRVVRMLTLDPRFATYDLDVHVVGDRDGFRV